MLSSIWKTSMTGLAVVLLAACAMDFDEGAVEERSQALTRPCVRVEGAAHLRNVGFDRATREFLWVGAATLYDAEGGQHDYALRSRFPYDEFRFTGQSYHHPSTHFFDLVAGTLDSFTVSGQGHVYRTPEGVQARERGEVDRGGVLISHIILGAPAQLEIAGHVCADGP
jgi:hypothetical protein